MYGSPWYGAHIVAMLKVNDLWGNDWPKLKSLLNPLSKFFRMFNSVERFPGSTPVEFMIAIAYREILSARARLRYSLMPEGLFYQRNCLHCTTTSKWRPMFCPTTDYNISFVAR